MSDVSRGLIGQGNRKGGYGNADRDPEVHRTFRFGET